MTPTRKRSGCRVFQGAIGTALVSAALASFLAFQPESAAAQETELEEIIVRAPRTLGSMRVEILKAENNALALFNDLNDDDDYDIYCARETPTGSHIPQRVCRPRYLVRLESRAAQDFLRGDIYYMPVGEVRQHDSILLEKLETLAVEHPELLQAVRDYHQLKTAYEAEREERFENSFFVR